MYVVKRTGKKEIFQEKKLHRSAYNACMGTGADNKTATRISDEIVREIRKHTAGKKEVKTDVIFSRVKKLLGRHNKECAYMYETYRDVS